MGNRHMRPWRMNYVFLFIVYLMLLCSRYSSGHNYPTQTQLTLCQAQCEALCLDKGPNCERHCTNANLKWITRCDAANCSGTCSVFRDQFNSHQHLLEPVPIVSIYQSSDKAIELSWTSQVLQPNYTTIYIIEETRPDPHYSNISTVSLKGWVRGNRFQVIVDEVCNVDMYRVMAINEYGSRGYSLPVKLPGLRPGLVQLINYAGQGIYYNKEKDPSLSQFMAILQWDAPTDWSDDDIYKYEWNPSVQRYCDDTSHDSLPIFTPMINQTKRILMTIAGQSVGCSFTVEVRAISKCLVHGPWTAFTVQLTNCRDIVGYKCQPEAFDPPGLVNNVSLSISSTPYSALLMIFSSNTLNPGIKSPLLINLHIHWQPPTDVGSQGVIDHYIIRSGKAHRDIVPIPPAFNEDPTVRHANSNIVELIFELPTKAIPYTYGVQIVAVAPGQVISDNQWGMFPMYTIQVGRNDSIGSLKKEGKILLDKEGIVIVYVNNTLPVTFVFDDEDGRKSNTSLNRYALQWGPLVGPKTFEVENRTIVPLNQTVLQVFLQHPLRSYGIKKLLLEEDSDAPLDKDWLDVPILPFAMPQFQDGTDQTEPFNLTPIYVLSAVIVFVAASTFTLVRLHKRHRFKNLERRLINPDEHDVDENDEHYFVMRTSSEQAFSEENIPTVVADRWELPHCCLKIGRVLGSGAFGQVVKGRVSKSVLFHRGIDLQGRLGEHHTHVTVAIKMLQEFSSETCSRDFLNEIQLMKDIGYHRNIVSILGCCTLREPYCLVVEHVAHGDLLTYLNKIRHQLQLKEEENGLYINQTVDVFSPYELLSVARQVSIGMEYLSQKGFVHRDLAARNILVGKDKNVKIGDFGLARYIYDDIHKIYVNRRGGKLPLRWLSPESIFDLIFSTASDVWSFGILLYEIVTLGGTPYPTLSNTELVQKLKQGYQMKSPDNCCIKLYDVMMRCWNHDPDERPNFTTLRELFTGMLEKDAGVDYFDFQINEQQRVYYRINSDEMSQKIEEEESIATIIADTGECAKTQVKITKHVVDDTHDTKPSTCYLDDNLSKSKSTTSEEENILDTVTDNSTYSNSAFMRSRLSNSSFHNGLYSSIKSRDYIDSSGANNDEDSPSCSVLGSNEHLGGIGNGGRNKSNELSLYSIINSRCCMNEVAEKTGFDMSCKVDSEGPQAIGGDSNVRTQRYRLSIDRTSGSSDEVFTDCPGCSHITPSVQCDTCGVKQVTWLDPRGSFHEDSAIGSTNSDDSNHVCFNDSDNNSTSTTSEEYIIPDSPTDLTPSLDNGVMTSNGHTMFDYEIGAHTPTVHTVHPFQKTRPAYAPTFETETDIYYSSLSPSIFEVDGSWTVSATRV